MNYINVLESVDLSVVILPMSIITLIVLGLFSIMFFVNFRSPASKLIPSNKKHTFIVFVIAVIGALIISSIVTMNLIEDTQKVHRERMLNDLEMNIQTKYMINRIIKSADLNPQNIHEQEIGIIVNSNKQDYILSQDPNTFEPTLKNPENPNKNELSADQIKRQQEN